MKKRISSIVLILSFLLTTPVYTNAALATARQNETAIIIDNQQMKLTAYNIDGYNYFRLRDICQPLNFMVDWNSTVHAIWVDTAAPYSGTVDDYIPPMTVINLEVKEQDVYINGIKREISSCNIDGYNYFKLRDIADLSHFAVQEPDNTGKAYFSVAWDNNSQSTIVATQKEAAPSKDAVTPEMPDNGMTPINTTQDTGQNATVNADIQTTTGNTTTTRVRQPQLTEPPEVGSQLAKILVDENVNPYNADGSVNRDNFTTPYKYGNTGQCTWYANGRFYEVLAIDSYTDTRLFTSVGKSAGISLTAWLDNADREDLPAVYSIREANGIVPQSIAVWTGDSPENAINGHVVFVEYVSYDANGNPTEVYFSEANFNNDNGVYRPNVDGTIKKQSFNDFINRSTHGTLKGYIAAK